MRFDDLEGLEREIESDLESGRAFVSGSFELQQRQRCVLVLIHPEGEESLEFAAEAVYVKVEEPGAGVGLVLVPFDETMAERLRSFAAAAKEEAKKTSGDGPGDLFKRVRLFTVAEQMRSAREGEFQERVALESVYGKAVWELLLRNRRITAPEILRISRTPRLPRHLVETITGNAAWLAVSALRRALLMNPQVTGASLDKVLRATPRAELTVISKQSVYPMAVRQAIKKLQGR
jgi:hypothetical protein